MRICVFGERLAPPPDEGIKKLTLSVASACRRLGHDTLTLTTRAPAWPEEQVESVAAGRLLRSPALAARLAAFKPHALIYVPTASLTLASGLRSRTLKRYAAGAPVALLATQGRRHRAWVRLAAHFAAPDLCAAQSMLTLEQASGLGWRTMRLPPGVDLVTFHPAGPEARLAARRQFGLPDDAFVVLHAGHLNRSRGVTDLLALADLSLPVGALPGGMVPGGTLPVLACSTSTVHDHALARELEAGGVRILSHFIPHIADLYAAADAYLFPVPPDPLSAGSIDVPLSVLEAAASGLPVVSTRFGALPELWPDSPGICFYQGLAGLRAAVSALAAGQRDPAGTRYASRALAEPFSWEGLVQQLLTALPGREERP